MPRGLFAMVMAFKDDDPGTQNRGLFSSQRLDINQTAKKYSSVDPGMSRLKKGLKDIRLTSGTTYGEVQLPESAPLVYPDLDRAASRDMQQTGNGKGPENESVKEKWKGAGKWVSNYLDRKAQAAYVSPLELKNLVPRHPLTTSPNSGERTSRLGPSRSVVFAPWIPFALQRPQSPG